MNTLQVVADSNDKPQAFTPDTGLTAMSKIPTKLLLATVLAGSIQACSSTGPMYDGYGNQIGGYGDTSIGEISGDNNPQSTPQDGQIVTQSVEDGSYNSTRLNEDLQIRMESEDAHRVVTERRQEELMKTLLEEEQGSVVQCAEDRMNAFIATNENEQIPYDQGFTNVIQEIRSRCEDLIRSKSLEKFDSGVENQHSLISAGRKRIRKEGGVINALKSMF